MTKEQFLNGDLFRTSKYSGVFKLSENKTYIESAFVASDGQVVSITYEANVMFVGRVAVKLSRFVINKEVKLKFNFDDLIRVDIEWEVEKKKLYQERKRKEEEEKMGG